MSDAPSLTDLERAANRTTPAKIAHQYLTIDFQPNKYSCFVEIVENAINFSISLMVKSKNIINHCLNEDQLTLLLSGPVLGMGLDISHSTNVGGHCDIVIRGSDEMLWLGEAKIFTDYKKLMGGFQQLSDRYATGMPNQTHGGIIIYLFSDNIASRMQTWREYLEDARNGILIESVEKNPLQFISTEPHRATQQDLVIRHVPVPLYHKPTDSVAPPKRIKRPT